MNIDSPPTRMDLSAITSNSQTSSQQPSTTDVRLLLANLGKEKISTLLHDAKIIANDYHDDEMKKWINDELTGYVPNANSLPFKEKAKLSKTMPTYRHINTKFSLQFSDGTISKENYSLVLGQDIKSIENWLDKLKPENNILTMPYTFPSHLQLLGGKSGDLEIPKFSLESIISGVEIQLSKYLELKL